MIQQFTGNQKEWVQMISYVKAHEQELYQRYGNNYLLITPQGQVLDNDKDEIRLGKRDAPRRGFVTNVDLALDIIIDRLEILEVE